MPIYFIFHGAWLLLQLAHHELNSFEVLLLRPELLHACHKVSGADIVEVIVLEFVVADVAVGGNHRVTILLTIIKYGVSAILKIGIEHCFKFYSHDITPSWLFCEVQQVGLGCSLHFGVGKPLTVVLIGLFLQNDIAIDEEILELYVARFALDGVAGLNTVELTVLDVNIVYIDSGVKCNDLHTIHRLFAGNVFQVNITHSRNEATTADLIGLVVEIDF